MLYAITKLLFGKTNTIRYNNKVTFRKKASRLSFDTKLNIQLYLSMSKDSTNRQGHKFIGRLSSVDLVQEGDEVHVALHPALLPLFTFLSVVLLHLSEKADQVT
jgi:hypothetical protein